MILPVNGIILFNEVLEGAPLIVEELEIMMQKVRIKLL